MKLNISIKKTTDIFEYGQYAGNTYIDIYRHSPEYIEYLIRREVNYGNDICFENLEDFYKVKPLVLDMNNMTRDEQKRIMEYLKSNNVKCKYNSYLITIDNIKYFYENNMVTDKNFIEFEHEFHEDIVKLNYDKLQSFKNNCDYNNPFI